MLSRCFAALIGIFMCLFSSIDSIAQDWNQWRGANQDGIAKTDDSRYANAKGLKLRWKKFLGAGYSGMSVYRGKLLATFADQRSDWVGAFDTQTGTERWRFRIGPMYRAHDGGHDGPLSNPVAEGDYVFALSAQGKLFALEQETGKEVWQVNCAEKFGAWEPFWGFCTTPTIHDNKIIVPLGGRARSGIVAFDTATGKTVWEVPFGRVDYRSPITALINGKAQVIAPSDREVRGLDPESGKTLWTFAYRSNNDMTPVAIGENRVLLTSRNGVDLIEVDSNHQTNHLWKTRDLRGNYDTAVYYQGHIYGFTRELLTCIDAKTGRRLWRSREPDGKGLILVDGQLISFGSRGHATLAPASEKGYQESARLKISSANGYASPAFGDGLIFHRDLSGGVFAVDASQESVEIVNPSPSDVEFVSNSDFTELIKKSKAGEINKDAIDNFLQKQKSFPIVDNDSVLFLYRGNANDVAIEGSMLSGGEADPMQQLAGTNLFFKSYPIELGTRWQYRFIVNFDSTVKDRFNESSAFGNSGYSVLKTDGWSEPDFAKATSLKNRRTTEHLQYDGGNARIWLPPGYAESKDQYPLLVVTDGQGWDGSGKIKPILEHFENEIGMRAIVAFVAGSRSRELGGAATGSYSTGLGKKLMPALEERYRVSGKPSDRILLGRRGGAVAAVFTTLRFPEKFGQCIAVSYGRADTVRADWINSLAEESKGNKPKFHIYWNRYEVSRPQSFDCRDQSMELVQLLKKHDFTVTSEERNDSSNWRSWRILAGQGIKAVFE